jgi:hypothetical protein
MTCFAETPLTLPAPEATVAEILIDYSARILAPDGTMYRARACGRAAGDGRWEGWIEFVGDDGSVLRTERETVQPNHTDIVYWATGLTPVYLEGSLERALHPTHARRPHVPGRPAYDGPAPPVPVSVPPVPAPILDPFEVFASVGADGLRQRLSALDAWHLRNIARGHAIATDIELVGLDHAALSALIVAAARTWYTQVER